MRAAVLLAVLALAPSALQAQAPPGPAPAQAPASPDTWRVDTSHSHAGFSVKHMMVSTVRGVLGPISGTVVWNGRDLSSIKADVSIDVTRLDTGHEGRDKDLRGPDFFDVERFPTATFRSTRVEAAGSGRLRLAGILTMHGVSKEVVLDVEGPTPPVTTRNGGQKIGASATTRINRRDFGLNYSSLIEAGPVVADEVTVTIDLQLNR